MTKELASDKRFSLQVQLDLCLIMADTGEIGAAERAREMMEKLHGRPVRSLEVTVVRKLRNAFANDAQPWQISRYQEQLRIIEAGGTPFEYKPDKEKLKIRRVQLRQARRDEPKESSYLLAIQEEHNELQVRVALSQPPLRAK